jgi:hypothetical protein
MVLSIFDRKAETHFTFPAGLYKSLDDKSKGIPYAK